jgi:hypothetical protein
MNYALKEEIDCNTSSSIVAPAIFDATTTKRSIVNIHFKGVLIFLIVDGNIPGPDTEKTSPKSLSLTASSNFGKLSLAFCNAPA